MLQVKTGPCNNSSLCSNRSKGFLRENDNGLTGAETIILWCVNQGDSSFFGHFVECDANTQLLQS